MLITTTEEQNEIIQALPKYDLIKVNAFAGTGKTSTLQLLTNYYPQKKFLYIAYNKSIQREASNKFGRNVHVRTIHSLAYKYVSKYTSLNLGDITNYHAKDFSKKFNLDYKTAQKVCNAFSSYCNSAEIEPETQPYQEYVKNYFELVNFGESNPSYDFILKKFHLLLLDNIQIDMFDTILLDEAQDSTDVIIDILRINAAHKVLVGDKHQQIYSFKDSKNAMRRVKCKELALTKTFRFPTNIAKYSNTLLSRFKGESLVITSDIEPVSFQSAINNPEYSVGYISRGNSALISKMIDLLANNEKFKTVREPAEIFRTIKDIGFFLNNESIKISSQNSFLKDLSDEDDLKSYIKSIKDLQLESTLRIFQSTFNSNLSEVFELENIANEYFNSPDICRYYLTTAHTAKGLEFDCTIISDDFFPFDKIINYAGYNTYQAYYENIEICNHKVLDEFNLFYVALTRCKRCTEIYDSNLFYLEADNWKDVLDENIYKTSKIENTKTVNGKFSLKTSRDNKMCSIVDMRLDEAIYTVFDFETTGRSLEYGDKVVEVAFAKYSLRDGIVEEFSSLINPRKPIPADASDIHGIYDEDVVNAPSFRDLIGNILSIIGGTILVAHNVYFDLKFIESEMLEHGITIKHPHLCTMYFPGFLGRKKRQSLQNACDELGINLINAHSALGDVNATIALLERHIKDSLSFGFYTFGDLKKSKKKYKFISSWNTSIPTYNKLISSFC